MIFTIFLISVLVLEGILRHDQVVIARSSKRSSVSPTSTLPPTHSVSGTSDMISLGKAIEDLNHNGQERIVSTSTVLESATPEARGR